MRKKKSRREEYQVNDGIFAKELRVITQDGDNLGVLSKQDALQEAKKRRLDLVVISSNANPPVAKIVDFGKFKYEQKKKAKEAKSKSTETKNIQVKIGTGEEDLMRKAKKASEWLKQGHRIKIDLYLWGRYKAMDENFLKERLNKFLAFIPESFKISDNIKKSHKGFTVIIEKSKK